MLANIDFLDIVFTLSESNNRGLNRKTNQKARYWDDAGCIAGEGAEEMFLTEEPKWEDGARRPNR